MRKIFIVLLVGILFITCSKNTSNTSKNLDEVRAQEKKVFESSEAEGAVAFLKELAEKDRSTNYYYSKMGYYYIELNQTKEAEESLNKALTNDEAKDFKGFTYNELAYLYGMKGDDEKALEYYLKGTENDKNFAENFYGVGNMYHEMGKYKEAIPFAEQAIKLYKKDKNTEYLKDAYNLLADIYSKLGDEQKMNETIKKGRKDLGIK